MMGAQVRWPAAGRADGNVWGRHAVAGIVELILADHRRIRRLQSGLREAARLCGSGPSWVLPRAWDRLAELIEVHISAEEEICWPAVSTTGPADMAQLAADGEDIREAIAEAALQPAGSLCWWRAVNDALRACSDRLDREERGLLAGLARDADPALRDRLGSQWLAFLAARGRDAAAPSGTGRPSAAGLPAPRAGFAARQPAGPAADSGDAPVSVT